QQNRAWYLENSGHRPEAEALAKETLGVARRFATAFASPWCRFSQANLTILLALIQARSGQVEAALATNHQALAIVGHLREERPENPHYRELAMFAHGNLAELFRRTNRLTDAERHLKALVDLLDESPPLEDLPVWIESRRAVLPLVLAGQGKWAEAEAA